MLTQLQIRDFALIEYVQLNFAEGMTTLTGETGAGKSILIDALGLILGDRANASLVRPGADAAEVIACFRLASDNPGRHWLREQALDEDDECIIRRLVNKDGRSKAWINGRPVSTQSLRDLGENLVAIHGQHENQRLLSRRYQRDLLDQYAGLMPLRNEVKQAASTLSSLITCREELQASQAARADRLELLSYQLEEIDQLQPEQDEFDRLYQEYNLLSHASKLVSACSRLADQLYDADLSLHDQISRAISELSDLQRHDATLGSIIELLETANVHLEEAAAALRNRAEIVEHDPEHLNAVQRRLDALHKLARKHRVAPEQLHEHIASLREEFASLRNFEANLEELESRIEAAWQLYRETATKLSEQRRAAARKLAKQVTDSIRQLGMPHSQFDIAITSRADESPSEYGLDEVE
ncbi:MAG TPA: DNA repair protein RecN, partial [Halothiobacillus sp.]|nr:DNA repair protein RecN [Halothiobacillus sp.]